MNHKKFAGQMRELCIPPKPGEKMEFFRELKEQGLLNRRPTVMNLGEFLAVQLFYIEIWIWVLSGFLMLFIVWGCCRHSGNYPFALTPFLAAGIFYETGRSRRWNMTELEQAARFSSGSVLLARTFPLGAVNTAGLLIVILAVRPYFSYSTLRVFLYMMVPFLTASLVGSVYERRNRTGQEWGSVLICILSSAFFAAAPFFFNQLYEERMTVLWAGGFIMMIGGLTVCIRKSIYTYKMGEPEWN